MSSLVMSSLRFFASLQYGGLSAEPVEPEAMSAGQSDIAAMLKLGMTGWQGPSRGDRQLFPPKKLIVKAQMDNTFGKAFLDLK